MKLKLYHYHILFSFLAFCCFLLSEFFFAYRSEVSYRILSSGLILFSYFNLIEGFNRAISAKSILDGIEKIFLQLIVYGLLIISLLSLTVVVYNNTSIANEYKNFLGGASLGFTIVYITYAFVLYKKLVLLRQTKFSSKLWKLLNLVIYYSLVSTILSYLHSELFFKINIGILVLTSALTLFIIPNNKWIAFIDKKTKLSCLLYLPILILILVAIILLIYFIPLPHNTEYVIYFNNFFATLLLFFLSYNVFAFFTLLFNWPLFTSLENQIVAVNYFNEVNQKVYKQNERSDLYQWLFDVSTKASSADAAFLNIHSKAAAKKINRNFINLDEQTIYKLKEKVDWKSLNEKIQVFPKLKTTDKHFDKYKSSLVIYLATKNNALAHIVLFKELGGGFDQYMINLIEGYANQALLLLKDAELFEKTKDTERFEYELNKARKVQRALFPVNFPSTNQYEIAAFNDSATEIGGDYYDFIQVDEHTLAVIIADVSGSGTSAGLYMAQLKGIFQAVVPMRFPINMFVDIANGALCSTIDSRYFVTLTICYFDFLENKLSFISAGHPSIIQYQSKDKSSSFFENQHSMAIGIAENDIFSSSVHTQYTNFESGDVFVLFTDGMTETKDKNGVQYGEERIRFGLDKYANLPCEHIVTMLNNDLVEFADEFGKRDDKTLIAIKIK